MGDIALATNAKLSLVGRVADVQVRLECTITSQMWPSYYDFASLLGESMTYLMM